MTRRCAYSKSTENFVVDELSHLHLLTPSLRGGDIHPSFFQSQPSPLPPVPLAPCPIGHPFPPLHCILSLSLYLTCLLHPKILCFPLSSYSYSSFFLLIFSNRLLESVDSSHRLSSFLSPISNLARLPSIPPKLLSVYFRPYLPRLLRTI